MSMSEVLADISARGWRLVEAMIPGEPFPYWAFIMPSAKPGGHPLGRSDLHASPDRAVRHAYRISVRQGAEG